MSLRGVTVHQIGDSVSAAAGGAMLTRLGATVIRVVSEQISDLTGYRPSGSERRLIDLLDLGKSEIHSEGAVLDGTWPTDLAPADITLVDISNGVRQTDPDRMDAYLEYVRATASATWVTISPYGLSGPNRCRRGDELTVLAAGGLLGHMRGLDGRPVRPAGYCGSVVGGHFAALAALHGLVLGRDRKAPRHFDVSLQDTVVIGGVFLECAHDLFDCDGPGGAARYVAPRGMYDCSDGWLYVIALEDRHWRGIVAALGNPEWANRIVTRADRIAAKELIDEHMRAWAGPRSAHEAARLMQREGVPATPVNSPAELLADPTLADRGFFTASAELPYDRLPGTPVVVTGHQPPDPPCTPVGRPLRVIELTHVLAGPLAGSWLGAMGVDVVKVENPSRPDFYRRRGPFAGGRPDIECSAYFAAANHSKRSWGLSEDPVEAAAEFDTLLDNGDFVIENLGARGSRAFTLDETRLTRHESGNLLGALSSSGWGRSAINADWRAYGPNIHAYGGAIYLTRDSADHPTNFGTSWADPLTSIWIVALTLAHLLDPGDRTVFMDVSMVEVVAYMFPEYFSMLTREGIHATGIGNSQDGALISDVFDTDGGEVALVLRDSADWERFCEAIELRSSVDGDRNDAVGKALSELSRSEVDQVLRAADACWSWVASTAGVVGDSHLEAREVFQWVDHPRFGHKRLPGLPWRLDGDAVRVGATPLLGADNDDIAREWTRSAADRTPALSGEGSHT